VTETVVHSKCTQCNKIVETTKARRVVSKSVKVTDQKRKDYLKSDFEVVHNLEDGLYCEWCGYLGGEEDFEEVEEEQKTELEEQAFDRNEHYKSWLQWVEHIKDLVKEHGEKKNERITISEST
jgi:hypothetical protein